MLLTSGYGGVVIAYNITTGNKYGTSPLQTSAVNLPTATTQSTSSPFATEKSTPSQVSTQSLSPFGEDPTSAASMQQTERKFGTC